VTASGASPLSKPWYNERLHMPISEDLVSCRVSGRGRLFLRAIAVVIFAAATACSRSAPAAEWATIDAPALFAQACAKCHAADGTGGLPMVANGPRPADLTAAEWQRSRSGAELITTIRDGRGAMPPFQDVLNTEQITALASHVRTLKRP
jgi:mono/diheme cytochrome c family protein